MNNLPAGFNLTSLFTTPDDLAEFCLLDNDQQAAKLAELSAKIDATNLVCTVIPFLKGEHDGRDDLKS